MKYILSVLMLALTIGFTACSPKGSGTENPSSIIPIGASDDFISISQVIVTPEDPLIGVGLTTQYTANGSVINLL